MRWTISARKCRLDSLQDEQNTLGTSTWRKARFWTIGDLRRLVERAGLQFHSAHGGVDYPPIDPAARLMAKTDHLLSRLGSVGAAFLAIRADKI